MPGGSVQDLGAHFTCPLLSSTHIQSFAAGSWDPARASSKMRIATKQSKAGNIFFMGSRPRVCRANPTRSREGPWAGQISVRPIVGNFVVLVAGAFGVVPSD